MLKSLAITLVLLLSACATDQTVQFVPSTKPALELRAAQTRLVPEDSDTAMRDVIATLHDLGYRITKVEAGAGTVSGTRETALSMAVVVQPRSMTQSMVRANATIVALRREAQVDSPEFYRTDFFDPLGNTMNRSLTLLPEDLAAPEPARPLTELYQIKDREAAAKARSATAQTPSTKGTASP
jgi:hypothetical protein